MNSLTRILLVAFSLSLFACASKPKPATEIYSNEPVVVANDNTAMQANEPPSMEPTTDPSNTVESSGIAAPDDQPSGFTEPPVEEMNGVVPPAESLANDTSTQDSSSDDMAALDAGTDTTADMSIPETTEPAMEMDTTSAGTLSGVPTDHYTVQVVASSTMENLNAFASGHNLSTDLTAEVTVNDKTWHVLLVGTYATLAEAKTALADIKTKVDTEAWIRKVDSLQ